MTSSRVRSLQGTIRSLFLLIVFGAGIGSIMATSFARRPFSSTGESFLLIYTDARSGETRARTSKTGLEWRDSNPSDAIPLVWTKGNRTPFSYVRLPDSRWLSASVSPDGRLEMRFVDERTARFLGNNLAPHHDLTAKIKGRPAITVLDNRIVLAWRRAARPRPALVTMAGAFRDGVLSFNDPVVFSEGGLAHVMRALDGYPSFKDGVLSDPTLSHGANGIFLMAVVRETWEDAYEPQLGETSRVRYRAAVYESEDGRRWTPTNVSIHDSELPVVPNSALGIAGFIDGTTVVAAVIAQAGNPRIAAVRSCHHQVWYELDAKAVFGGQPLARPFVLVSVGETVLPKSGDYLDCAPNR